LGGILTISLLQGKLYRNTEKIGEMDPFVQINYIGTIYKTKTKTEAGKNPVWNESFDIPIQSMSDFLEITIFDEDNFTNDYVGSNKFTIG
jgi:Ca2+-dependent lipid-binding protein